MSSAPTDTGVARSKDRSQSQDAIVNPPVEVTPPVVRPAATSRAAASEGPADFTHEKPVTLRTIQRMTGRGEPFACLTCYDATTARWLERAGVHILLVGDTAAEMILGLPGTIHAPLDFLITLTAAVKRGAPRTLVMGDMPFMSYQASPDDAMRNAGRFLTAGAADIVKLEVNSSFAPLIQRMTDAGIPTVAHIGSKPQHSKLQGGYLAAGKTAATARRMIDDAVAMEQAGAAMLLVEACPNEVSRQIVERTSIPVIGCGGGPACHGQIVVLQDLLGLTDWQPAFARPIAGFGQALQHTGRQWVEKVAAADLGEHPYHISPQELEKL